MEAEDAGKYRCVATNVAGETEHTVDLEVYREWNIFFSIEYNYLGQWIPKDYPWML